MYKRYLRVYSGKIENERQVEQVAQDRIHGHARQGLEEINRPN